MWFRTCTTPSFSMQLLVSHVSHNTSQQGAVDAGFGVQDPTNKGGHGPLPAKQPAQSDELASLLVGWLAGWHFAMAATRPASRLKLAIPANCLALQFWRASLANQPGLPSGTAPDPASMASVLPRMRGGLLSKLDQASPCGPARSARQLPRPSRAHARTYMIFQMHIKHKCINVYIYTYIYICLHRGNPENNGGGALAGPWLGPGQLLCPGSGWAMASFWPGSGQALAGPWLGPD